MNYCDVVANNHLMEDDWSTTAPLFGAEGQIKVLGWSIRRSHSKLYVVRCSICAQDPELFGGGYFGALRYNLYQGKVPCGCEGVVKWSKAQYEVLCERRSAAMGYEFMGFVGDWKGAFTGVTLLCKQHGEWNSGLISTVGAGNGCPCCGHESLTKTNRKPDEIMIKSFLSSEGYHPETKFWRSDRVDTRGHKIFWYYECQVCGGVGESSSSVLQRGGKSCLCSSHQPKEAYINMVVDCGIPIAIKFGIANSTALRLKQISCGSVYSVKHHSTYSFKTSKLCRSAETSCKQQLECGIVLARDMRSGYTETTWVYNLEKIVEIYELNGGVRVD